MPSRSKAALYAATLGISMLTHAQASASAITEAYAEQFHDGSLYADDARYDGWRAGTSERSIEFSRIVERTGRTDAYFHERAFYQGRMQEAFGVIAIYHADGKILGEEIALLDRARFDLAASGQLADVATTMAGLSRHMSEANPLGLAALPIKYGMHRYTKSLSLQECIDGRAVMGSIGWGATAMNLAAIAGAMVPGALLLGGMVALAAYEPARKDAPARCVEKEDGA